MEVSIETIAAIATPPGVGGVGIIRISGPDATRIYRAIFSVKSLKPRYVQYGHIEDPKTHTQIDQVCAIYFKAPHSYTGEDVIEFHCHSGPYILKSILALIIEQGAQIAGKGEFTKRAFLNGKMDLTTAESVIDLIHASSQNAHYVALSHLKGSLFNTISKIRKYFMAQFEQIEGSMDFPDEVPAINRKQFEKECQHHLKHLSHMVSIQDYGRMITGGIRCVIVGRPNAGKSSLLNTLLGESRSIVTSTPGTTRDYIDAEVEIGGVSVTFTDTAGIRESSDKIEKLGQSRVKSLIRSSHIVLWVMDNSDSFSKEDIAWYKVIKTCPHILVVNNKTDLKRARLKLPDTFSRLPICRVSAKKATGIHHIKDHIYNVFCKQAENMDLDLVCNIRQLIVLKEVKQFLEDLIQSLQKGFEDDVLSIDVKAIIHKLGELTGEEITEETLDGIFSRFCVGK
ncbi:MAG: tRNA uridine-5-carboxymethylaminomethyl(34) synthesis GTPase MnmE [Candidatus Margulisbacteria bacterium]|nr:tRNA uridine-5-carboxymethylaminomethyl(34) synthesis GTPase MnmE [Candidatus Margulisiibacteriota bacterium]